MIEPNSKSAYLGSGFPTLGASVQDFMVIAEDFDLPITSSSANVTSAGPAVLKIQAASFTPAIFVEISAILSGILSDFLGDSCDRQNNR